jgi:hypothetical protein
MFKTVKNQNSYCRGRILRMSLLFMSGPHVSDGNAMSIVGTDNQQPMVRGATRTMSIQTPENRKSEPKLA